MAVLISLSLGSGDNGRNWKAPKGLQFSISEIYASSLVAEDADYFLIDELSEEAPVDTTPRNWIFRANGTFLHELQRFSHRPPLLTKYLTFRTKRTLTAVWFTVIGELVPLTRAEAIWQWFRKGR